MVTTLDTVRLDREIHRTTAPNGMTVLSERVPTVRSTAVGVWVRTASAHEQRPKMGVSHLLEHMVFKGTEKRTAQEIALSLESRGGSLDAYTSRDATAYQARVLDTDLARALDVITDMVHRPTLRDSDLSLERQVVLEEIATVEDTPDDEVFDLAYGRCGPPIHMASRSSAPKRPSARSHRRSEASARQSLFPATASSQRRATSP